MALACTDSWACTRRSSARLCTTRPSTRARLSAFLESARWPRSPAAGSATAILRNWCSAVRCFPLRFSVTYFSRFRRPGRSSRRTCCRKKPDHINIASLGNVMPHLHWHIIPRYRADPRWGGPIWPEEAQHRLTAADEAALKGLLKQMLAG